MSRTLDFAAKAVASGLFVSYPPVRMLPRTFFTGAGLLGALWGWVLLPLTPDEPVAYAVFLLAATLLSVPVSSRAERAFGRTDDPRIILDEIVGFWWAAAFLPREFSDLLLAFILFRIFDVFKPGPIRRLQALHGGWGIVLDDALAGAFACALIHLARWGMLAYTNVP